MELLDAIKGRRSVRKFTDHYVTDEEITDLLEAARMAPSWVNFQVWEFIVVRDKGIIERIVETYFDKNPARKGSLAASAMIVGCVKLGISGVKDGKDETKFSDWYMFDLALAVQNLCLRAHDIGLGTVTVGAMDHDRIKEILSVPEEYEVVVTMPIGKPLVPGKEGPPRKELKDFVHLDSFGKSFVG